MNRKIDIAIFKQAQELLKKSPDGNYQSKTIGNKKHRSFFLLQTGVRFIWSDDDLYDIQAEITGPSNTENSLKNLGVWPGKVGRHTKEAFSK